MWDSGDPIIVEDLSVFHEARVKLITEGLELRGALTPIHDLNPFTQSRDENL